MNSAYTPRTARIETSPAAAHGEHKQPRRSTSRSDTFGDETQWTDTLRMDEVIRTAVDPTTALSVGLKVDAEALPAAVGAGIQNGSVDLKSPATTVALLKLKAVVGLKGTVETVNGTDVLTRARRSCPRCRRISSRWQRHHQAGVSMPAAQISDLAQYLKSL